MKRIAAVLFALGADAAAEPVAVKVIDAAGGETYIEPGEAAGLRVGTRVAIGGETYVVSELNAKTAVVHGTAAIGATGTAEVTTARAPRAAEVFREQWPAADRPARTQSPAAIALAGEPGAVRLTLVGHGFGVTGALDSATSGELRVIADFARLAAVGSQPLGAELDVAARVYSDGWNRAERIPIAARAAALRLGSAADPALVAGRLRYAATSVGMLDGGRARVRAGALELAAFGGLVPDPVSGEPDTGAARFGAEAIYAGRGAWRPRAALAVYGSTWDGALDERRLAATASVSRGRVWLDGWAEAQAFADDNPFAAAAVELTGAGASGSWRSRRAHASLGVALARPERSLRLAAALPADWLCRRDPAGACLDDRALSATASAGARGRAWSIDAIASAGHSTGLADGAPRRDASGYLRGELRSGAYRVFVAPSAATGSFADWLAVELGAGLARRAIEASLAYRPELLAERAASRETLHSLLGDVRITASPAVDLALTAVATLGGDRDAVAALTSVIWRAR